MPTPAFTFFNEGGLDKTNLRAADVPPGALIAYLQKGLEYVSIEEHINEVRAAPTGTLMGTEGRGQLLQCVPCQMRGSHLGFMLPDGRHIEC